MIRPFRERLFPASIPLVLFAVAMLSVSLSTAAPAPAPIPLDRHGLPQWRASQWSDFPVELELADKAALAELLAVVPIASFEREQIRILRAGDGSTRLLFTPRVTAAELAALRRAGFDPVPVEDVERRGREAAELQWSRRAAAGDAAGTAPPIGAAGEEAEWIYHTNTEVGQLLTAIAAAHPAIARAYVWGTSVEGRDLWGIVISDSVDIEEPEPEVRLSGTIHGNEPLGLEMLLALASLLTDGYGVDPGLTGLVDDREIHILPLHNPDGYAGGIRYNAYGLDLNRDFPVPDMGIGQERENVAFMAHGHQRSFVVSANFHSGALVVNYPWDHTFDPVPDEDAVVALSLEYSSRNTPMYYSPTFLQGITNGAAWYVTMGCLQDWSYDRTGCIDLTIELSDTKWPAAAALSGYWDDNRESLLAFIDAAGWGVGGVVTDAVTGEPVAATVSVAGNAAPAVVDPDRGDYHKLLPDGTWTLDFAATGYQPLSVGGVITSWGEGTVLDVALAPLPRGEIAGVILDSGGAPLSAALSALRAAAGATAAADSSDSTAGGAYSLADLPYGDYLVVAAAAGHLPDTLAVTLSGPVASADLQLDPIRAAVIYADDFEQNGVADWEGGWLLTHDAAEGEFAITDTPLGGYGSYMNDVCALREVIDLSLYDFAAVSFRGRWSLEPDYDCVRFELSADHGSTWQPLCGNGSRPGSGLGVQTPAGVPCFDGDPPQWSLQTFDLTPWAGSDDVRLRFVLASDESSERDGFYFDDFRVEAGVVYDPATDAPPAAFARLTAAYPNPFNPSVSVRMSLPRDGPVRLTVHDARGRTLRVLLDQNVQAGERSASWDGRDDRGVPAAAGVYFVRLTAGDDTDTGKVVLVR